MKDEFDALLAAFDRYLGERRLQGMRRPGAQLPQSNTWGRVKVAKAKRDALTALTAFVLALAEKAKRRDRYVETLRAELGDAEAELVEAEEAHARNVAPSRRPFIPQALHRNESDPEKTTGPTNIVWTTRRGGGDRV